MRANSRFSFAAESGHHATERSEVLRRCSIGAESTIPLTDEPNVEALVQRIAKAGAAAAVKTAAVEPPGPAIDEPIDPSPDLGPTLLGFDREGLEPAGAAAALAAGASIGRYLVVARLGSGGMGLVYRAYDTRLRREVALKLLTHRGGRGAARMLREAQAMAQLSHPNVVPIYDVDRDDTRVFIAMGLVEGATLSDWLSLAPRRWQEILDVLIGAGRGLAAAHRAGLVHRDFKPSNVMVDSDSRARVMDFGLVRDGESSADGPAASDSPISGSPDSSGAESSPGSDDLTVAGAVVGTPAYMAPEQHRGGELDARADQYAFATTLFEALAGKRPFPGKTARALQAAKDERPDNLDVKLPGPSALQRAILRGLEPDPDRRFASMDLLLAQLEAVRRRFTWRRRLSVAGLGVAVVAGGLAWNQSNLAARVERCEERAAAIESVWAPSMKERVSSAIRRTELGYADATADAVMPWLDDQAAALRKARSRVCLGATVEGTWEVATRERADWCLDERQMELEVLVEHLLEPDAAMVEQAVTSASTLRRVDECLDAKQLGTRVEPPVQAEAKAVFALLARAAMLRRTADYGAALEVARDAETKAEKIRSATLRRRATFEVARVLSATNADENAEPLLKQVYFESETEDPGLASGVAAQLAVEIGVRQERFSEAWVWARLSERDAARAGRGQEPLALAERSFSLAVLHQRTGDWAESKRAYERAIELHEGLLGPDHPRLGRYLASLATLLARRGDLEGARRLQERALVLLQTVYGPDHPEVATCLHSLANVQRLQQDFEGSIASYERAIELREAAFGIGHVWVAHSFVGLALAYLEKGQRRSATGREHPRSRELLERAIEIYRQSSDPHGAHATSALASLAELHRWMGELEQAKVLRQRVVELRERSLGPNHPVLMVSLVGLANVHLSMLDDDEARQLFERTLQIHERAEEGDDLAAAMAQRGLAEVLNRRGQHRQAEKLYRQSLKTMEESLGADHAALGNALAGLALVSLEQDDPGRALPYAERAVRIRAAADSRPAIVAETWLLLARALWDAPPDQGRDRGRAIQAAGEGFAACRDGAPDVCERIANWKSTHR